MSGDLKKSIKIGAICIASYMVSYYMRNVLGVLTPEMLETGLYTKEYIGFLSSVYFLIYATGQLVNGIIGDMISPKKMIASGLCLSGAVSILFVVCEAVWFQILCFGLMGFGLSMLRGPLMKVISEGTIPKHARVICVFFSAASFVGSFIASFLALIFRWKAAFVASGVIAFCVAAAAYTMISYLERNGMIQIRLRKQNKFADIMDVFKLEKFGFYLFAAMLIEIAAASIGFWIPTYLTEHLGFGSDGANFVFSAMSVLTVTAPFITLGLIKIFGEVDIKIMMCAFLTSAIFYLLMRFTANPWLNIAFFILARISAGCASAMLWSVYIPSLGNTGKVSSVNGILDCAGYVGAAIANAIFGSIVGVLSWNGVVFVWSGLMFTGFLVSAVVSRKM